MSNYIVAFLDMLGTTRLIQSESSEEARKKMHFMYEQMVALSENQNKDEINVSIFSDNLLVAQKLDGENDSVIINHFIQSIAAFQFSAVIDYHWLLRGGVTIGDLYIDDIMVWGNALVRSHNLESGIAYYPRVIIDPNPDILNRLRDSGIFRDSWLQYDMDGQYFVDYLHGQQGYRNLSARLSHSFDCIIRMSQGKNGVINERVFQKLGWHKRYVNRFLRTLENPSSYLSFPPIEAPSETT